TNFNAKKNGKQNLLSWSTTKEENVLHYDVQRSFNGREFASIGIMSSRGGSAQAISYEFADQQPGASVNFYRLKIVDKDGKTEYSATRKLNNALSFDFSAYPNPV